MNTLFKAGRGRMPGAGLAVLLAAMPVSALRADNLTRVVSVSGHCTSLMAMNITANPNSCSDKVVNFDYPNGRIGFVFLIAKDTSDSAVISFFGSGERQTHRDRDHAIQPIDRVHLTFHGGTDDFVAKGTCRFENPYFGKPAEISCSATTSAGQFVGRFLSNGVEPDMSEIK